MNVLAAELKKRAYMIIEEMGVSDEWGALYKVIKNRISQFRVVKTFALPADEIITKLMIHKHKNIIEVFEEGIIECEGKIIPFIIQEFIDGKSLGKIEQYPFWENNDYSVRINLINQTLEAISVFRQKYELHYDLHMDNIMLTVDNKIKIIDFSTSQESYKVKGIDIDLYFIKKEIIPFFFKEDEIKKLNEKINLDSTNFKEIKVLFKKEINDEINKNQGKFTILSLNDKLRCITALENITNFYFKNLDDGLQKPKDFIDEKERRDIMPDIQILNTNIDSAIKLGIIVNGNWDSQTHSRGINNEIFISANNYLFQLIQHEFGETIRIFLTLNGELVLDHKGINGYLKDLKVFANKEESEPMMVQSEDAIVSKVLKQINAKSKKSLGEVEEILGTSSPDDWTYDDDNGIYVYKPNVDLTVHIRDDVEGNRDDFYEDWIDNFSNKHASKVIVRVYYRGSFIKQYFYVYVDGGRMILPLPKAYNDLTITPFQYNLGRILNCQKTRRQFYRIYIIYNARFRFRQDDNFRGNIERIASSRWKGYCIRCREQILLDNDRPHCYNCWQIWNKYKNPDYEESYCHECGESIIITRANPFCEKCR